MAIINKNAVYCIMQENGVRQWLGKRLSLKECQEKFNCTKGECSFERCPCLKVIYPGGNYYNQITDTFWSKLDNWDINPET
jgi:hypothetical protein